MQLLQTIEEWLIDVCGPPGKDGVIWASAQWHMLGSLGGEPITHVGIVQRDVLVNGQPMLIGGVCSVTTRPEWRGRGYASEVMCAAATFMRDELKVTLGLLLCESDMIPFYCRTGWMPLNERPYCQLLNGRGQVRGVGVMILKCRDSSWPGGVIDLCGHPW